MTIAREADSEEVQGRMGCFPHSLGQSLTELYEQDWIDGVRSTV